MRKFLAVLVLVVLCLIIVSMPTSAHHLWLNATRYTLPEAEQGGETIIYFGWGDLYPLDGFLNPKRLQSFHATDPTGRRVDLTPGKGGFLATEVALPQNGTYLVAANTRSFRTAVVESGKRKTLRIPKDEIPKSTNVVESVLRIRSGKAIINVGDISPEDNRFSMPVGQELEIIPMKNPYHLKEGDSLPFRILLKGEPVRRPIGELMIKATYVGFSTEKEVFAQTAKLDDRWIGKIKIVKYGIWQIFVYHVAEPPSGMTEKADRVQYSASLTFEVR